MGKMRVCVIGLGQIGLPVAQYAQMKGLDVWGYDISPVAVKRISETEKFQVTSDWTKVPKVDAFIICVTTGQLNDCPDISAVFDVCKKVSEKTAINSLVSIESTIVPGTSKRVFKEIFNGRARVVHVPHRYWADEPERYGVNQIRVIGGVDDDSLKAGLNLYRDLFGIPLHVCPTIEIAEMCKIAENSHRYLQIAFAEDLKMLCNKIGTNFDELRVAMNTKWNVDLPEARDGIGRHCLPKDIRYVISLAPSTLLDAAIRVDKQYREWLSQQKSK